MISNSYRGDHLLVDPLVSEESDGGDRDACVHDDVSDEVETAHDVEGDQADCREYPDYG